MHGAGNDKSNHNQGQVVALFCWVLAGTLPGSQATMQAVQ